MFENTHHVITGKEIIKNSVLFSGKLSDLQLEGILFAVSNIVAYSKVESHFNLSTFNYCVLKK